MPQPSRPVWTLWRQLVGNLLPLAVSAPLMVLGVRQAILNGLTPESLFLMAGFVVAAWIATNFLGPCGGWGLKSEIGRRLHQVRPFDKTEKHFVGFAKPGGPSLLDPHQDVGYLILHPERLEFFGGHTQVELSREDVQVVRYRPNPHSWLGLGRWVSVEGTSGGVQVRLLVEPRERPTLLGNRKYSSKLAARLKDWLTNPPSV